MNSLKNGNLSLYQMILLAMPKCKRSYDRYTQKIKLRIVIQEYG